MPPDVAAYHDGNAELGYTAGKGGEQRQHDSDARLRQVGPPAPQRAGAESERRLRNACIEGADGAVAQRDRNGQRQEQLTPANAVWCTQLQSELRRGKAPWSARAEASPRCWSINRSVTTPIATAKQTRMVLSRRSNMTDIDWHETRVSVSRRV